MTVTIIPSRNWLHGNTFCDKNDSVILVLYIHACMVFIRYVIFKFVLLQ